MKALAIALLLGACGGGEVGDPFVSGAIDGNYDGEPFTATNGFATVIDGTDVLGFGDGPLHCGSEQQNDPPSGNSIAIGLPSFDVGTYPDLFVQMFHNASSFEAIGSGGGTVEITASSDASVAGTLSYSFTDTDARMFTASGTFEVVRCP